MPFGTAIFKTAALNHSATAPSVLPFIQASGEKCEHVKRENGLYNCDEAFLRDLLNWGDLVNLGAPTAYIYRSRKTFLLLSRS